MNDIYAGKPSVESQDKVKTGTESLLRRMARTSLNTAAILGLAFAGYSATSDHWLSKARNHFHGSGQCYEWSFNYSREGDTYWKLSEGINPKDRGLAMEIMAERNVELGVSPDEDSIPKHAIIEVLKPTDCSKQGAKTLSEILNGPGLGFFL